MSSVSTRDLKKWEALGLPQDWVRKDSEGASYLLRSRLIYSIVGFCSSTKKDVRSELQFDEANGLQILQEGKFVSVAKELSPHYSRDASTGKLEDVRTKRVWMHLGTGRGLLPVDRWHHHEFVPVTQIDREDQERLLQQAFHQDPNGKHRCVVQVVTQVRGAVNASNPLTRSYHLYKPVHAFMRIIDAEGNVYSTGLGAIDKEDRYTSGCTRLISARNAVPTILDYEEFLSHQARLTTSIAISSEQCTQLLEKIAELRKTTVRFQSPKHNCNTMAVRLLAQIGVQLNLQLSALELLFRLVPFPQTMRRAGRCVCRLVDALPTWIGTVLKTIAYVALFIPKQAFNLVMNIALMILGSNKGSPLPLFPKDLTKPKEIFEYFDRVGWAFFGDRLHREVDSSPKMIEWQLSHKGTWVHQYRGPAMGIVAPGNETLRAEDEQVRAKLRDQYEIPSSPAEALHG